MKRSGGFFGASRLAPTTASGPKSSPWTFDPSFSSMRPACSREMEFPETSTDFAESR
jgi:hypothetical protein